MLASVFTAKGLGHKVLPPDVTDAQRKLPFTELLDGEGAFLQCGLGSLWCYIPAALAGGTKGASSSLCWQSPGPSAGAEGEAAEVRLSTPSARNTFECPRDEFYSHRVLKLCPKMKKDPSDSPAFKNLPSSAQRCGFLAFGKLWTR